MIEINELRIGNIFQDEDKTLCYFAGAWERSDGWVIRDSAGNTYKPAQIFPVPLTPDLLKKYGFEFKDMMFANTPMRYWRKDWLIWYSSGEVHLWNEKEAQKSIITKYFHQLQNLSFALTGQEIALNAQDLTGGKEG
jgi:hypothetical protein